MRIKKTLDKAIKTIDKSDVYIFESKNDFDGYDMSESVKNSVKRFADNITIQKSGKNRYKISADIKNENAFVSTIEMHDIFKKWIMK